MNFEDARRIGLGLAEVEQSTYYGTHALKVRGQWLCRMWGEREYKREAVHDTAVLVVRCDSESKQVRIDSSGGVLFETPHYHGHGAILVRLTEATEALLRELLIDAYRIAAPDELAEQCGEQGA